MTCAIYTHDVYLKHDTGADHPERIARIETLVELFREDRFENFPVVEAEEIEYGLLALVHDRQYIQTIEELVPETGIRALNSDTFVCPDSWEAAMRAAGAVCQAVDDVLAGKYKRAFCAGRPPGHHAEKNQAMGFCLFNNIALGARYAQKHKNVKRVAIIDFDVHHGNGTQQFALTAKDVFFVSSHQAPFYPYTGERADNVPNKLLNLPMAAGEGSAEFRKLYKDEALPALEKFKPDLVMISAGFDAHKDDPLGEIELDEEDFIWITKELVALANKHCGGKIVSVLEGGYDLNALKASAKAHLLALSE